MEFRPTLSSFLGSSLYSLLPAVTVGVITYVLHESFGVLLWIAAGAAVMVSVSFLLTTVYVHLQRIYVDDDRVRISMLGASEEMRWGEVTSAVLRERPNVLTRTDHMLVLQSGGRLLYLHTSTLSPEDEERVLAKVRQKTKVMVQQDRQAV